MRAWRFVAPGRIEPHDVPLPEPEPEEAVVRVGAAGLCRTDLHILSGEWPFPPPLTLGHEAAGTVAASGRGVGDLAPGTRVAIHPVNPCGTCPRCAEGRDNICARRRALGHEVDGAFAEFVRCRASALVEVPPGVDDATAAVATDAVLTPYHALATVARVREGEVIAILGLGGLGMNAVQIGRALGARMIAVDPSPSKRERARALGAEKTFSSGRPVRGTVDVALDLVGSEETIVEAQAAVRPGGRVVLAGLACARAPLLAMRYGGEEVSMLGATSGTRAELAACLDLLAAGTLRPVVERHPLDVLPRQVERLAAGEAEGRIVLVPGVDDEADPGY